MSLSGPGGKEEQRKEKSWGMPYRLERRVTMLGHYLRGWTDSLTRHHSPPRKPAGRPETWPKRSRNIAVPCKVDPVGKQDGVPCASLVLRVIIEV
jgi:hypothetical protein